MTPMAEKTGSPKVARPRRRRVIEMPPLGVMFRLRFEPRSALTEVVFEAIAAGNPELRLERTANGELEIMSPTGMASSDRNAELTYQLRRWTKDEGRGLGKCFDSNCTIVLPNAAIRSPDASWIRQERWDVLTAEEREKSLRFCPDFVVELVSPSDRLAKARTKMQEYMEQGARLGWLIDPIRKKVEIYRTARAVESLDGPKTLSGEDVLPGFVCDLEEIYKA
jgi:Uma2 family endonuclease